MADPLLSLDAALERLLTHAQPITDVETLPLEQACGRVLATAQYSPIALPPWDNSAMDGYALCQANLPAQALQLPITQRIPAGAAATPLIPGSAARIFTGAPLPSGADTVVIQEQCIADADQVTMRQLPRLGANIRYAGEDLPYGSLVLAAGTRLQPQHLGVAAALGIAELPLYRRLRVAVLSSGNELVPPGQSLGPGQTYNANQFLLIGLLRALGCDIVSCTQITDHLEASVIALENTAAQADLVLASGGVSVGEADHLRTALAQVGILEPWQLAIRPGKPLAYGRIGNIPCIAMPGNPLAVWVSFLLLARPFILHCQGIHNSATPTWKARADFAWPTPDKRREFLRARLHQDAAGQLWVSVHPSRSSASFSSLIWAEGLAMIPEQQILRRGDLVTFLSIRELLS